ncbi:beta strand repeat-containing protein [Lacipirellula limnantheis]|uniref:Autotransporter-associated beta strand repeat protein n=1 Tax=Lacipirellula limnantheis TaxID=2528024 RepID=A0A517TXX7_9BACT|nr:hypothetical protein [Lacipirellula limnantheis]QDT73209.1 hypothetical protein I41_23980 [Lacipirellula limnantheis]
MTHDHKRVALASCLTLVLLAGFPQTSWSLPRTWIGGNVDWDDAGSTANWTPADEPDADDEAIFNSANTVNLGTGNSIQALTMSAGIDLNINGQNLTIDGLVQLTGASTILIISGSNADVDAGSVTINSGGAVQMAGGQMLIAGLLDINAGGTLRGYGTVSFSDVLAVPTTLLSNDGTISASHPSPVLFGAPIVDILSISSSSANSRIDLDGVGVAGAVTVGRNQTLDVNDPLSDAFSGSMLLSHNSTFDILYPWTLDTGTITATNGFVDGGIFPDTPADVSVIAGAALTQTGGTITVADTDGTLRVDAPLTMNGGTLTNNGLLIFNADATIAAGANFALGAGSDFTVGEGRTVTINQTNFNMDGTVVNGTRITVNSEGRLNIDVSDYDSDSITNRFDGVLTINSGFITVNSADAEFVMDGTLNMNNLSDNVAGIAGWNAGSEPLDIGDDTGSLDAKFNAGGAGSIQIAAADIDFNSDADIHVLAGVSLDFLNLVNFNTVNGANNAEFTGAGRISFTDDVNVNEAVTLNMVGGTVDLDGTDGIGDTINVDAPLTINAAHMSNFGNVNGGGGPNTLDVNNSVGTGVLTVNLDDPADEWTLNAPGMISLVNDNVAATLLTGSDVNLNGQVTVTGDVRTTARVDIGSTSVINITTANEPLRLAGGDNSSDPNTIDGGLITGIGPIAADTGKALHGFGTINSGIDFDGSSNLKADDGTLTLSGSLIDVNILGTADTDGMLNIPAAWNTSTGSGVGSIGVVSLSGGTLQGGVITNDNINGIQGFGTVTSRVINNAKLIAANGPTLIVQTAGNNNDWDGGTGTGELRGSGATLEVRDIGQEVFTGTVTANAGGRVFTNGISFDFSPASTINLDNGTLESANNVFINGTVTVGAGPESTIKTGDANFLDFNATSSTTLIGNLRAQSPNTEIAAGATFSGTGALVVPDGSFAVADANANVNVLLINDGVLRPAGFDTVGRVDVKDYQQGDTGELFTELTGTGLNQFDRLVVNGAALLDGYLNIDIDGGFIPALGNTFNILTASGGVSGVFDYVDVSGMPVGLAFHLNYQPTFVQLQVVNKPNFSADFDDDGDVDPTDVTIWKGAFNLSQLGDADGDNDSDGNDFLLWQRQFGSIPAVAAATAVPEPETLLLIVVAAVSLRQIGGGWRQERVSA